MSYLLLLETSGNQAYIYATNKLKENVGASELTFRAGTQWALEAAESNGGPSGLWDADPRKLRENIRDSVSSGGITILLATSGKAMIVVEDDKIARKILSEVTERAIKEAPGMDLCGAIIPFDAAKPHLAVADVHKRFGRNRSHIPTPEQRFNTVPVAQPCAHSGLPASHLLKNPEEGRAAIPVSRPSYVKREWTRLWHQRIGKVFERQGKQSEEARSWNCRNIEELEKLDEVEWLAIVHADGNGLGQIFTRFDEHLEQDDYQETLRNFSLELDEITETAFYRACQTVPAQTMRGLGSILPVVPVLLGGDDLTVVMDGHHALPFIREYLRAFEQESARQPTVARIAKRAFGVGRLGICAGVAIVKPHFPFHSAYHLAESLLRSAKKVKQQVLTGEGKPCPCAALDFHVLYDGSYTGLDAIRARQLTLKDDGARLFGGPYVVSDDLSGAADAGWANAHRVEDLEARVSALLDKDKDGRRNLPNSQMHTLREALFMGRNVSDARLREIAPVYREQGLTSLYETGDPNPSLFRRAMDGAYETRFLDAIMSAPFWRMEG
jgi:hypothetical protein